MTRLEFTAKTKLAASGDLHGRASIEWIGRTPDSKPPKSVVDRLFLRQSGRCAITGVKMYPYDRKAVDHKKRLKDGGENREKNLQIILEKTHIEKTVAENAQGDKERRVRLKHQGLWPAAKHKIANRGFEKRGKS